MGTNRITKDMKATGSMNTIPKDATILGKDTDVTVKQIENGFIICKRTETKYSYKTSEGSERTDYSYETKEYYTKEDPLTINTKDKSLADLFQ